MTFNEAVSTIEKNQKLIGKTVDNLTITHLVITPKDGSNVDKIVKALIWDENYEFFLQGKSDFEITVFYDLDDFSNTGVLFKENLENVLRKIPA